MEGLHYIGWRIIFAIMQMHLVNTPADKKLFLQVAVTMYKNDPHYIRPLDKDIEEVFDPQKNKFFKRGECCRWILKDDAGNAVGRVAAFVNKQYKQEQPTGGIGFFECINNQEAANFIFNHCRNWLLERGMEAMDGPINFGERDKWWGLLTEGFYEPLYCMNYNPPYYKQLFENYGFKMYFNQICYALKVASRLEEKFYTRHKAIKSDTQYAAVHLKKNKLQKYAKDFTYIYNKAWAGHGGGKTLEEKQVIKMFKSMKPVMDETLNWFVYYNDEPIAFWVNLPDLNQYFKYMKGKFGVWQKIHFLLLQKLGNCKRFVGLVFGIIPEFQGKGIDAYMIVEGAAVIQNSKKYVDYEMQWIGDFNPKMINIVESLGTHPSRKLGTYRYLFNREIEFKRHPMLA
jgi:hypothetical protein